MNKRALGQTEKPYMLNFADKLWPLCFSPLPKESYTYSSTYCSALDPSAVYPLNILQRHAFKKGCAQWCTTTNTEFMRSRKPWEAYVSWVLLCFGLWLRMTGFICQLLQFTTTNKLGSQGTNQPCHVWFSYFSSRPQEGFRVFFPYWRGLVLFTVDYILRTVYEKSSSSSSLELYL